MLAKKIKYVDYNGEEREETFYFNLTKTEIFQMEYSMNGGLSEFLTGVIDASDATTMFKSVKEFILNAQGVKSNDGKHFVKNAKTREDFESSPAFDALFMELITNDQSVADFVNALVPLDVAEAVAKAAAGNGAPEQVTEASNADN